LVQAPNLVDNGPFTLVTNYFLPEQAAQMKSQAAPSLTAKPAMPFKGTVSAGQK
jgi:hypothetical protein